LYTAITTKPDTDNCSFLILVRQKYFESRILEPATKVFQSDCDRSQNDTWGGGMAFNKNLMYLSIGENRISYKTAKQFTKFYTKKQLERKNTYFGKVISINLLNFNDKQIISMGHRNPTGLYFDSNSSILYASEFGPEGGDEINLILKGKDYGYPETSFGRIYDEINPGIKSKFPMGYLNYFKYTTPLISYVPSINPVQLFVVNDLSEFKDWRKNLIVGCLSGKILRIVLDNDENGSKVILSEQIEFGARIRDLTEISNSSLLASTDDGLLVLMSIQN
jgi:glucose/arabinose dehydrogenase